ncbi:3-dehydroquinate dehydratase-1 [Methanohalophilus levihalophilus]|uniref:type I 3-dehydroquinate dehydratase n=1 Tax=Methanohalophilus levihalophilus TaxID=1431282 RepID=UPI001AE7CF67|nr:type I 3-dehydroquinate dehydratase [Methanohalophilus levihalophilus]MBP2030105.1 3-dehydroquinate dehydratase-1 [Methanohalophilus levihalophilus]
MLELPGQNRSLVVASIDANPYSQALAAKNLGADVLELRLDLLGIDSLNAAIALTEQVSCIGLPCIATNRIPTEGGCWAGEEEDRLEILEGILPYVEAVDIEMCAPEKERIIKAAKRNQTTTIVSSHFFESTPSVAEIRELFNKGRELGADITKLATMPQSPTDVLKLLEAANSADSPVCAIAMGKIGSYSRVVGGLYGSVLTYGCIGKAVAPGQLRVDKVKSAMEMLL